MENHRNVITKREVNVSKNITVYCGKNITPKHGQNPSKMSIANKNINIAHDNMFRDTKSHYSRVKVSQKPPKTMAHYTDMKNGEDANLTIIAILQTIVKVAPLIKLAKQKVRLITQRVLKIDFGLYVLRRRLSLVHMVPTTW